MLLPASVLAELTDARVAPPFLFRVVAADAADAAGAPVTHARAIEFTAPDGNDDDNDNDDNDGC